VLSGTDSSAFNPINNVSFAINNNPQNEAGAITESSHSNITRISAQTQATADSNGVIYWAIAPVGTDLVEDNSEGLGSYIVNSLGDYFNTSSSNISTDTAEESEKEVKPNQSDASDTRLDSWTSFERRLYKDYLTTTVYMGAVVSTAGNSVVVS